MVVEQCSANRGTSVCGKTDTDMCKNSDVNTLLEIRKNMFFYEVNKVARKKLLPKLYNPNSVVFKSGVPRIFERRKGAYNHNQICLVEKFFQVVAKKKGLPFESVLVLLIFLPKNVVISKKNKKRSPL